LNTQRFLVPHSAFGERNRRPVWKFSLFSQSANVYSGFQKPAFRFSDNSTFYLPTKVFSRLSDTGIIGMPLFAVYREIVYSMSNKQNIQIKAGSIVKNVDSLQKPQFLIAFANKTRYI